MSSVPAPNNRSRVAAILVVANGGQWLPSVLATLAATRYEGLDLVVVDNASTDGSADLLARRIPADRLLRLTRNQGFGRAVAAAVAHPVVAAADYLLLLHDDLALAPEAIGVLAATLDADPRIGIAGPKLREWSDDGVLAELGMTIDRLGRAEPRVEPRELDQGQHDRADEVLYVNTAGMLVRRELLRQLGGFDARFPAFGDDLDLCWRAWLSGSRVEVVPAAVGYHIGAGTRAGRRFGGGRVVGVRYLRDRHTIAAMLKNYGAPRLVWVLPLVVLLGVVRVLAYLAVRRFGDAGAVARAYVWNATQLAGTLRRRSAVQRRRTVSDGELGFLFAPGLARARVYAEAFGGWLAGGSTRALIDEDPSAAEAVGGRSPSRIVRERPAAAAALVLLLAYLVGLWPLLGAGQVVGGWIAPWPESALDFLRAYVNPVNGEPFARPGFASPVQAVLGVASLAGLGSRWLAQRLLVFGLLPLGWLLALRAGRLITSRPGPRALGATLYVLSPVVLGALGQGRYGILVVAALLPGLLLLTVQAVDPEGEAGSAWRATALLTLGLVVAVGAAPSQAPVLAIGLATAAGAGVLSGRPGAVQGATRLGIAAVLTTLLLSPWLVGVMIGGRLPRPGATGADAVLPMWRAITVVPEVLPGLGGLGGALTALTSAAVVVASVLLGLRRRPDVVALLATVAGATAVAAWAVTRIGVEWLWPPSLLLPAALAIAGLGVLAARSLTGVQQYAFGARQLSVVVATSLLGIGLLVGVARLATGPYEALTRNRDLVPPFVAADTARVGPYRVLLLADERGEIAWDVTSGGGPSMVGFGTPDDSDVTAALAGAVAAVAGGGDPRAGTLLGIANIRYVVVSPRGASPELARGLAAQPSLEPLPTGAGRVYRVSSWLPRAVVVPEGAADRLLTTGDPGNTRALEDRGLSVLGRNSYRLTGVEPGVVVLSETGAGAWEATTDEVELEAVQPVDADQAAVTRMWRTPTGTELVVQPAGRRRHALVVALQALLFAAVLSLALRPPGFTQRREERATGAALPRQLADASVGGGTTEP